MEAMVASLLIHPRIDFGKQAIGRHRKLIQPTVDVCFAKPHLTGDPDMRHANRRFRPGHLVNAAQRNPQILGNVRSLPQILFCHHFPSLSNLVLTASIRYESFLLPLLSKCGKKARKLTSRNENIFIFFWSCSPKQIEEGLKLIL
jgi:hypothetical protein